MSRLERHTEVEHYKTQSRPVRWTQHRHSLSCLLDDKVALPCALMPWKQKTRWLKEQPADRQTDSQRGWGRGKKGWNKEGLFVGEKAEKKATLRQTSQTSQNQIQRGCNLFARRVSQCVNDWKHNVTHGRKLCFSLQRPAIKTESSSQETILILLHCAQKQFMKYDCALFGFYALQLFNAIFFLWTIRI